MASPGQGAQRSYQPQAPDRIVRNSLSTPRSCGWRGQLGTLRLTTAQKTLVGLVEPESPAHYGTDPASDGITTASRRAPAGPELTAGSLTDYNRYIRDRARLKRACRRRDAVMHGASRFQICQSSLLHSWCREDAAAEHAPFEVFLVEVERI